MTSMSVVGGLGIGSVWGWLIGRYEGKGGQPLLRGGMLAATTGLVASEIWLFLGWVGAVVFIGSAGIALVLRLAWRREIETRVARLTEEEDE